MSHSASTCILSSFVKPSFDDTLGALLIGLIVAAVLFGLTTLQTYMYYVEYREDRAVHKWLVGILWVLDFIHTIFISHSAYDFLIRQYGNTVALLSSKWSTIMEVTVTAVITVLVQLFFAYRIYRLSHGNWIVSGSIAFLAFVHAALGIFTTIRLFLNTGFPDIIGIVSAELIVMAVNDVLITVASCWYLQKAQRLSGTHGAVSLLIIIETGMVTSIFVIINVVCLLTMPLNWIHLGAGFCLSKLYANSLLTVFNSRRSVRQKFGGIQDAYASGGLRVVSWPCPPAVIGRVHVAAEEHTGGAAVCPEVGTQVSAASQSIPSQAWWVTFPPVTRPGLTFFEDPLFCAPEHDLRTPATYLRYNHGRVHYI